MQPNHSVQRTRQTRRAADRHVRTHTVRSLLAAAKLLGSALFCAWASASPNLDEWVAANTSPTEKTACIRQVDDELFFVAMAADDKVRLGNRLDMTGHTETHGYTVAWMITNEKGRSVVAKVPSVPVGQRYVKQGSKVYADNVKYQTLNTAGTKLLRVEVQISKCAVWLPSSQSCRSGQKAYTVRLCEITL